MRSKSFCFAFILLLSECLSLQLIDLGHDLSDDTPTLPLPGHVPFHLETILAENISLPIPGTNDTVVLWFATYKFTTQEHIGTHFDAPYHFNEKGWTVDQVPLERLFAPAVVIDITEKVEMNSSYLLSEEDVTYWINKNGVIPNNSVVLLNTGWSKKYNDTNAYLGIENEDDLYNLNFPGYSLNGIKTILKLRESHDIHVLGFGLDAASLHPILTTNFIIHREVASQNIYILENLNNLDKLPATGVNVMIMPIKIRCGTGGPARVIAKLPND